ncbi:hypothetical protein M0R36_09610 [bacterium]|jgi:hypothetical protein|nr:hypothetical protein [bacterium]
MLNEMDSLLNLKKFKGRKLSFFDEQIQKLIKCIRNSDTEFDAREEWKEFKKMYISNISKRNPFFLLNLNHFIADLSLLLEMKRKYFFSEDEKISDNIEETADTYIIKMFFILNELVEKCFIKNEIDEGQLINVLASYNSLAVKYLQDAETQMGKDVMKPYIFYSIIQVSFTDWYSTYCESPLKCIEKYIPKEEEPKETEETKNEDISESKEENKEGVIE